MSDHIVDAAKMVPDGFYNALVKCDTGGEMNFAVRVYEGRVYTPHQYELRPDACSDFTPLSTWLVVSNWPQYAVDQLDALRTENAALVERVKRLEEVLTAGVALMRATDPFTLPLDEENDEGITVRQLDEGTCIGWDEPPNAGQHIALHDAVLAFGRAVAEAKATQ
jgi:hypothetical protein